jgi:broad specificity phosphatase PhoE
MRHGESTWNASGRLQHRNPTPPLTDRGRRQSSATAAALRGTRFDLVLTSPALRARQTAQIVADVLGLDVADDDRLVEMDADESVAQVRERLLALVSERRGELLVVSHGDTIAVAVEMLTGRPCPLPGNGQVHLTAVPAATA